MHKYAGLIYKLIIFTCCLVVYLYQTDLEIYAATVLISFISSCLLSYFDDYRFKAFITVGFSVTAYIIPEFMVFLPLIAFDMMFHNLQAINLLALIPLVSFFSKDNLMIPLMVLIMLIFSILLRYQVETVIRVDTRHKELSDTAREMSIQLTKQNHDLIEKQDNELNLATMNERNRIAREIHDNVGHLLASAILQSGALKTINNDVKLNNNFQALNETLTQAMNSIRNSVHELYDESVDLEAKVSEVINNFTFCGIDYSYNISGNPDKKLKYTFISILKEALTNIINHSDATEVIVAFNEHPALYQLIIRDNGKVKSYNDITRYRNQRFRTGPESLKLEAGDMPPPEMIIPTRYLIGEENLYSRYNTNDGMGIRNMVDRVQSLDGNINIITKNGFEIFISVPKEV